MTPPPINGNTAMTSARETCVVEIPAKIFRHADRLKVSAAWLANKMLHHGWTVEDLKDVQSKEDFAGYPLCGKG